MGQEVKRFKRVLHVRTVEREITQSELAGQLQEEGLLLGRLSEMENRKEGALADFCAGRSEAVSPQQFWFERQNIDILDKNVNFGKQELEYCRGKIEETKAELLIKHQNVQLMEKYVDKLKDRADKEMLAVEQKNLDDITSMRYKKNISGEAEA
jgi:flagellar export protein FliJ